MRHSFRTASALVERSLLDMENNLFPEDLGPKNYDRHLKIFPQLIEAIAHKNKINLDAATPVTSEFCRAAYALAQKRKMDSEINYWGLAANLTSYITAKAAHIAWSGDKEYGILADEGLQTFHAILTGIAQVIPPFDPTKPPAAQTGVINDIASLRQTLIKTEFEAIQRLPTAGYDSELLNRFSSDCRQLLVDGLYTTFADIMIGLERSAASDPDLLKLITHTFRRSLACVKEHPTMAIISIARSSPRLLPESLQAVIRHDFAYYFENLMNPEQPHDEYDARSTCATLLDYCKTMGELRLCPGMSAQDDFYRIALGVKHSDLGSKHVDRASDIAASTNLANAICGRAIVVAPPSGRGISWQTAKGHALH